MKLIARDVMQRGVTLVELVISIVIISVGLAGIVGVINRNVSFSADPMVQHQAVAIAEAYLEEILLKDFCDPGSTCTPLNAPGSPNCDVCPAAEGSRPLFDNICDYNNRTDVGARNQADTAIGGLGSYTVQTNVFTNGTFGTLTGANCQLLRVEVTVTGLNAAYSVSAYRTNYQ